MYWGYSPALDLQEEAQFEGGDAEVLRALLVGSCDARHLIKTLARRYRYPGRRLEFLVSEASEELVARQMLLLTVALEPSSVLAPQEKARLFMELHGNLLVRAHTARYLSHKAAQLALMVADQEYQRRRMPLLDLDMLPHRQRDVLHDVFSFWAAGAHHDTFRPVKHWDDRLRRHLGSRYDSRDGVFDWDYHMGLAEREGGSAVDSREYRHWRTTGVAFTWPEVADQRCPNYSLASAVVRVHGQLCHHGYLGDIVNGPYLAFGVHCEPEDADLLKKSNTGRLHRSADVAERNLLRMFHELEASEPYEHEARADQRSGGVVMELPGVQEECLLEEPRERSPQQPETYTAVPTGTARVTFLPVGAARSGRPLQQRQDVVFLSQSSWQSLKAVVGGSARAGTRVLAETRALLVGPRTEQLQQFGRDLGSTAGDCGCVLLAEFDGAKDPVARFKVAADPRD